jgi:protein-disulfide isomerase
VDSDLADGKMLGVQGTPTFFIGFADRNDSNRVRTVKSIAGDLPFSEFKGAIEEALSRSNAPQEPAK